MSSLQAGRTIWAAFALAFGIVAVLSLLYEPHWRTNDDVGMSMAAHGYGLAAYGSPNLIFSNVIWGHLVRATPTLNGVLGYSLAAMVALGTAGWGVGYFLLRSGTGYRLAALAALLVLTGPTLFPQFTITAGLLAAAAVMGWCVHARDRDLGSLIFACALALPGFLIRWEAALLIALVSVPILPWRALLRSTAFRLGAVALAVLLTAAIAIDRAAYRGAEWRQFLEFESVRGLYIDFSAANHLREREDILRRYGYSQNDMELLKSWFFVDSKLADVGALKQMLLDLEPLAIQPGRGFLLLKGAVALFHPALLPTLAAGILLLCLAPSRPVVASWCLSLAVLAGLAIAGRPGVRHVYVPVLSLLLVATLALSRHGSGFRRGRAILLVMLAALCCEFAYSSYAQARVRIKAAQVRNELGKLPPEPFYAWGARFPYQAAYPVYVDLRRLPQLRICSLGSDTFAPYGYAFLEENAGRGMVERLLSEEGLRIVAGRHEADMLGRFCSERFAGTLRTAGAEPGAWITLWRLRCESGQSSRQPDCGGRDEQTRAFGGAR